MRQTENCLLSL